VRANPFSPVRWLALALIAAAVFAWPASAQNPWVGSRIERGRDLLRKLTEGDSVRIVAFGDSLTAGWSVWDDPRESYPHVFCDVLRHRFPQAHVELWAAGVPGDTSSASRRRFDRDVVDREPDLVIVQLGGNDKGTGRKGADLYYDLTGILRALEERTKAAVIVCTPPIVTDTGGETFLQAVRKAAEEQRVALADLDAALLVWDHDYRGVYPWAQHPGSDVHSAIAKEIYSALDQLLQTEPTLVVEIEEQCEFVAAGGEIEIAVRVRNTTEALETGTLRVEVGDYSVSVPLELAAGDTLEASIPYRVPQGLIGDRSQRQRILAVAVADDQAAFDARWLTLAPVVLVRRIDTFSPRRVPSLPDDWRHVLSGGSAVLGDAAWGGPWDLEGRFGLFCDGDSLYVAAQVTDDELRGAEAPNPVGSDLVEVWLDGRPGSTQGRAAHSREVFGLLAVPNTRRPGDAVWGTLDDTPRSLRDVRAWSQLADDGYAVQVEIPLAALGCDAPEDLELKGFDLAIDDADGDSRDTQFMWAGGANNYIDASLFGALTLDESRARQFRLCLR